MNCPLCGDALAERGFFCKVCAAQVRCKTCREVLEPNAAACVECGTRVGQSPSGDPAHAISAIVGSLEPHRNTLNYEETRNNRTFSASLTDTAVQGLGEILGDFFVQRGSVRTQSQPSKLLVKDLALPPVTSQATNGGGSHEPAAHQSDEKPTGDINRIAKIFAANGEALELTDNRLKAKNQSDFVRRLTYLFLYAHELNGRQSENYDNLRTILQVAKVWDANTRTWLAKRNGFTVDPDNRFKLNAPGREAAIAALNDALNPEVVDDWNPDKKVPRKVAPRKKT